MDLPTASPTGRFPCLVPFRPIARVSRRTSSTKPRRWSAAEPRPTNSANAPPWRACYIASRCYRTPRRPRASTCDRVPSASGAGGGPAAPSPWKTNRGAGASPIFSPLDRATVQAIACETVFQTQQPLSRQSVADLTARAQVALGKPISRSTVWRLLNAAALKPWRYEHWIFPRDPQFAEKAGVVLDLYAGLWQGEPLTAADCILSADEKTSIQARRRCQPTLGPAPGRCRRVEHEYERGGALQYLAAWDVRRAQVFGRCEPTTGLAPFGRLVADVMGQEPYRSAARVFWVVDNGSSHRGQRAERRLREAYPNAILVHTPVHASWLNQVEIYFSLIQRKVLTPNDFASLAEVELRLRLYEELTNRQARPFDWKFTRTQLERLLRRIEARQNCCRAT
jgi:DDE superfamily endonuclease